jgi:hypothetical protein
MNATDRRIDHARRRRIELLIARVRSARAEIIARGLDAVHGPQSRDRTDGKGEPPPKAPPPGP